MKPIKIKGIFDHPNEIQVRKNNASGEKGVEIITPFYTHLNSSGEPCGVLVNRGWVPADFRNKKYHYNSNNTGYITGILYTGDAKTKYSKNNEVLAQVYHHVTPSDFALLNKMNNLDEASQFMVKQIDTDEQKR